MHAAIKKPPDHILIIFGASGDLTKRKLLPALAALHEQNLSPEKFAVLGLGRSDLSDEQFREIMKEGICEFSSRKINEVDEFLDHLSYYSLNTLDGREYSGVKKKLLSLDKDLGTGGNFIFYLATPPSLFSLIPGYLAEQGLNRENNGFRRLIVEKPFGHDLNSAKELNNELLKNFDENQIYRIDHYLGKETVQNLLVTRFSNGIFEPSWNRNFIHHIEITSTEDIGVENRGGYYEESGALRDMVQNHLLLLTSLVAMEPPTMVNSESIRNEIFKVMQALRPVYEENMENCIVLGQYTSGQIHGREVKGYRQENKVDPESKVETFAALKFFIDNWRWAGVPFYIRTGKMMPERVTEIVIHFHCTPHHLFSQDPEIMRQHNQLVIRIQPDEGLLLKFGMKVPGAGFKVRDVNMDFHYSELSEVYLPSAYERLLMDCMRGDPTLYSRGDVVELAWKFIEAIIQECKKKSSIKVHEYPAGTWGPEKSMDLMDGSSSWRYPCKNLSGGVCEL